MTMTQNIIVKTVIVAIGCMLSGMARTEQATGHGSDSQKHTDRADASPIREVLRKLESSDSEKRQAAFDKLASRMDEQTISLLISDLCSRFGSDVDGAGVILKARLLALSGDVQAVPVLLHLVMNSGDRSTRYTALWGLGRIGDPVALPGLETAYDAFIKTEDFRGESEVILEAMGAIGTARAASFLGKRLIDDTNRIRDEVAWSLGQIQLFSVARAFDRAIDDPAVHGKEVLARGIARMGGQESIRVLRRLLQAESPYVRARAASYLAYTRSETWGWTLLKVRQGSETLPYLVEALEDEHEHVRANAAEAIGMLGDSAAFEALVTGLSDESKVVAMKCIGALGQLKDARIAPLLVRWATDNGTLDVEAMVQVARSLGQLRDARGVPLLKAYAVHDSSEVRSAVTESLLLIGGDATVPPLVALAQDSEVRIRRMAIVALGLVANVEARTALEGLAVSHDDSHTASIREAALWMCAGPHDQESLETALSDARTSRRLGAALLLLRHPSLTNLRKVNAALNEAETRLIQGISGTVGLLKNP